MSALTLINYVPSEDKQLCDALQVYWFCEKVIRAKWRKSVRLNIWSEWSVKSQVLDHRITLKIFLDLSALQKFYSYHNIFSVLSLYFKTFLCFRVNLSTFLTASQVPKPRDHISYSYKTTDHRQTKKSKNYSIYFIAMLISFLAYRLIFFLTF